MKTPEDLWPGNDRVEKTLHRSITAAFPRPASDAQHSHPTGHTQHRLDDPAHPPPVRFRQIGL
jgi:hypothetical protein